MGELLRFHCRMAASKPTSPPFLDMEPFQLNQHFGAFKVAVVVGCDIGDEISRVVAPDQTVCNFDIHFFSLAVDNLRFSVDKLVGIVYIKLDFTGIFLREICSFLLIIQRFLWINLYKCGKKPNVGCDPQRQTSDNKSIFLPG